MILGNTSRIIISCPFQREGSLSSGTLDRSALKGRRFCCRLGWPPGSTGWVGLPLWHFRWMTVTPGVSCEHQRCNQCTPHCGIRALQGQVCVWKTELIWGRYLPHLQVCILDFECFHLRSLRGHSRTWETPLSPYKTFIPRTFVHLGASTHSDFAWMKNGAANQLFSLTSMIVSIYDSKAP